MNNSPKRKYIPRSAEATMRRQRAQRRNYALFQIAAARSNLLRVAYEINCPTKQLSGVLTWLHNQVKQSYEFDPNSFK